MAYNVLIVDDSLAMRAILKKVLKASGFNLGQIFEAGNGKEALEAIKKEQLDIVLTDYNMPVMNGLELVAAMKKNDLYKDIPVVVITTEGSRKVLDEFMEKGARDYIKKPFTPETVRAKLNNIMGESEDGQEIFDDSDEELDF